MEVQNGKEFWSNKAKGGKTEDFSSLDVAL